MGRKLDPPDGGAKGDDRVSGAAVGDDGLGSGPSSPRDAGDFEPEPRGAPEHRMHPLAWDLSLPSPSGRDHGVGIVPPFAIVRVDVSWQLAGMSSWAALVLS